MYLLPTGVPIRNRKLGGYMSRRRSLGLTIMRNGNGGGTYSTLYRTLPAITTVPTSQLVLAKPPIQCLRAAPPGGCTWLARPTATDPCGAILSCPPPVMVEPTAQPSTSTAGTPVPAGFSINQIFVAANGSQWIYSSTQGKWINVGIPYSTGAPAPTPVTTLPAQATVPAAAAPTPALVSTAPAESSYQQILDWLKEETLISGVPNWVIALAAGALLLRLGRSEGSRR